MSQAMRSLLRNLIRVRYDYLLSRLSYCLGSKALAGDALHDAFVRLERAELSADLQQPVSYVLRMATNIAANMRRGNSRLLSMDEALQALEIPDETQDPEGSAEHRSQAALVKRALSSLPERQRTLLVESWLDEVPTAELARRHGMALRTVQHEIKSALEQIRRSIAACNVISLRQSARQLSRKEDTGANGMRTARTQRGETR